MTENKKDTPYVAVIGDIRGSRELDNRRDVQKQFQDVVASVNDTIPNIASSATVTTGDEFQVLLTDAEDAVKAAIAVTDQLHPTKLRFGIGYGELATDLNENEAIGMDGTCFHEARWAIDEAKKDGAWVRVSGWPTWVEKHVHSMFDVVQCIREDWTESQAKYALTLKEKGSQKEVAEYHGVVRSTVSESLQSGHVQEVRAAERSLASLLAEEEELEHS